MSSRRGINGKPEVLVATQLLIMGKNAYKGQDTGYREIQTILMQGRDQY